MTAITHPTPTSHHLGAELRRLRQASGLTGTQAAERLLVSQPTMSRLELGQRAINARDVRDLCAIYGVTDQHVIDTLMQMARRPRTRVR